MERISLWSRCGKGSKVHTPRVGELSGATTALPDHSEPLGRKPGVQDLDAVVVCVRHEKLAVVRNDVVRRREDGITIPGVPDLRSTRRRALAVERRLWRV